MTRVPCLVVKLGGSLQRSPWLPRWLDMLVRLGGGRVVVVPGGGRFADEVRAAQAHWQFSDLHGHNMAVLGMAQLAEVFHALQPALVRSQSVQAVHQQLAQGNVPVWQPLDLLRQTADELTHWDATSDSCAAWLARQLPAQALWLVKACEVPPEWNVQTLSDHGILDRAMPDMARLGTATVQVLSVTQLAQAEQQLAC